MNAHLAPTEKSMRRIMLTAAAFLAISVTAGADNLFSNGFPTGGIPAGGPYVPAGTLYDNEQSDGSTSLASQDSSGTTTARSADDFTIAAGACGSGQFAISQIRIQMVQNDAAPQPFEIDIYDDNGAGTAPTPANSISPIANFVQTSSTNLGAFGTGTSIWEASFDTTGLTLAADTVYWISGYGGTAASNAGGFNNFFAVSAGSGATTDNGVIIAPGSGVASWTPAEVVIGGPPLAFSFAIDGTCAGSGGGTTFDVAVPTLSEIGLGALIAALALVGFFLIRRVG